MAKKQRQNPSKADYLQVLGYGLFTVGMFFSFLFKYEDPTIAGLLTLGAVVLVVILIRFIVFAKKQSTHLRKWQVLEGLSAISLFCFLFYCLSVSSYFWIAFDWQKQLYREAEEQVRNYENQLDSYEKTAQSDLAVYLTRLNTTHKEYKSNTYYNGYSYRKFRKLINNNSFNSYSDKDWDKAKKNAYDDLAGIFFDGTIQNDLKSRDSTTLVLESDLNWKYKEDRKQAFNNKLAEWNFYNFYSIRNFINEGGKNMVTTLREKYKSGKSKFIELTDEKPDDIQRNIAFLNYRELSPFIYYYYTPFYGLFISVLVIFLIFLKYMVTPRSKRTKLKRIKLIDIPGQPLK